MSINDVRRANLARLLAERFEGNKAALARALERPAPQIHRVLAEPGTADSRAIGEKLARKIEQALALPVGWLDIESVSSSLDENATDEPNLSKPTKTGWRRVPVRGTASLGDDGYWAELEYPAGHGDGYIEWPTQDPDAYAIRCRGDSMRPRLKNNEFVIIEPNTAPQPGDEVLIRARDGRVMVKELVSVRDNVVRLLSVNETYGAISIALDQIEVMHFVGGLARRSKWVPSDPPPRTDLDS